MSRNDLMVTWSKRPSDSELARIDRTERMVRDALKHSQDLHVNNAKVFVKGSVKMRTNIRTDSDIDLCVKADDSIFFSDYPQNMSGSDYGHVSADYLYRTFRKDVHSALVDAFGASTVEDCNKAIKVHGTVSSSRIDADIVPAFEYRLYDDPSSTHFQRGIAFVPSNSMQRVINWPHHNYKNTLAKHEATHQRYRKMIRILKRMREAMRATGYSSTEHAGSFLIESLLWNVPVENYFQANYEDDMKNILTHLKNNLGNEASTLWGEVNELKYLFGNHQKWTLEQASSFISEANTYFEALA